MRPTILTLRFEAGHTDGHLSLRVPFMWMRTKLEAVNPETTIVEVLYDMTFEVMPSGGLLESLPGSVIARLHEEWGEDEEGNPISFMMAFAFPIPSVHVREIVFKRYASRPESLQHPVVLVLQGYSE